MKLFSRRDWVRAVRVQKPRTDKAVTDEEQDEGVRMLLMVALVGLMVVVVALLSR